MKVTFSDAADFAMRTLDEDERRYILTWVDQLENWENDEAIRSRSKRLPGEEDVYLLRIGNEFCLFFSLKDGGIIIQDIALEETLRKFHEAMERSRR